MLLLHVVTILLDGFQQLLAIVSRQTVYTNLPFQETYSIALSQVVEILLSCNSCLPLS